jgi:hypothetical protein
MTDVTPLEFLEAVYSDEELPLTVRMRAAIEAAPYRHPKLSAAAIATIDGQSFAEALDRCIERSKAPLRLNPPPPTIEHDAEELKQPNARLRRF